MILAHPFQDCISVDYYRLIRETSNNWRSSVDEPRLHDPSQIEDTEYEIPSDNDGDNLVRRDAFSARRLATSLIPTVGDWTPDMNWWQNLEPSVLPNERDPGLESTFLIRASRHDKAPGVKIITTPPLDMTPEGLETFLLDVEKVNYGLFLTGRLDRINYSSPLASLKQAIEEGAANKDASIDTPLKSNYPRVYHYVREDAYLRILVNAAPGNKKKKEIELKARAIFMYFEESAFDTIKDLLNKHRLKKSDIKPGRVYTVTSRSHGLDLTQLGHIECPLEKGNYTEDVFKAVEHACADLGTATPCGRFILLEGPPGSGKSYIIRGIISAVDARFVIIPASLFGQVSGPGLLPLLSNDSNFSGKTVLVLEDADESIMSRGTDNLSKLSDILNFGDGILGELADVSVIATTNAKVADMDKAVTRPGRLCAHIKTGLLQDKQALEIYKRLTEKDLDTPELPLNNGILLAEIYRRARQDGWKPPDIDKSAIGFAHEGRISGDPGWDPDYSLDDDFD